MQKLYQKTRDRLKQAGSDNPGLEARIILRHVLGVSDADFISFPDRAVRAEESETIETMLQRRLAGEPISRILGQREFWGLPFKLTPDVLDPRPDTETLVEVALKRLSSQPPETILDLGTGSGCILIALLSEWKHANGIGVDRSFDALKTARENAVVNDVGDRAFFYCGSWMEALRPNPDQKFGLIVSNPPYITNQAFANLPKEVKNHDPILALDGGENGLQAYKKIFLDLKGLLKDRGTALFEIGYDQQNDVVRLAEDSGLSVRDVHADLAGLPRVVEISSGDK